MRQGSEGTAPNWDILAAKARALLPLSPDGAKKSPSAIPNVAGAMRNGFNLMTFRNAGWQDRGVRYTTEEIRFQSSHVRSLDLGPERGQ